MHCGLICGIWDWQSTIVEDLNDSQDPKHMLFCRKNASVAIYALFSDNKCPLFTRLGGAGSPEGDNVTFFYRFFISGLPLIIIFVVTIIKVIIITIILGGETGCGSGGEIKSGFLESSL